MSIDTVKANEGVVTSIGDTDLVMVCASGGGLKPISFANLAKLVRGAITVGVRNLALNTSSSPKTANGGSVFIDLAETLYAGEELTVSFEIDYGDSRPYMEVYLGPTKGGNTNTRHMFDYKTFSNGLVVQTFTLSKDVKYFGFYTQSGNSISISKVMITRGNVQSSWSPAPEDLRGGVIGCLPITCGLIGKGGAYDGYDNVDRDTEGGADGYLGFRTLDTLCEWLGSACEKWSHACGEWVSEDLGYKRRSGLDCREIGCLIQYNPELSRNRIGIDTDHFPKLSDNFESRRWRRNLLPDFCEPELDGLEKSIVDFRVADRKEVAYV